MNNPGFFKMVFSYFFPISLEKYHSMYSGNLMVVLENGKKVLNTNDVNYSYNSLHRVFKTAFKKSKLTINKDAKVLILGMGGGSIIQILREDYLLSASIKLIEIDPIIIEIACKEFGIKRFDPLDIVEMDALTFINENTEVYNLICVDIFINDRVPEKFLTVEFIQKIVNSLELGGSIYFNFMIPNDRIKTIFEDIFSFLLVKKDHGISNVFYLDLEENNKVLIVKK